MSFGGWTRYLLPDQEREDPALRQELTRVSLIGLRAIFWVCLGGTAFMLFVTSILKTVGLLTRVWLWPDLAIMGAAFLAIPFLWVPELQKHARLVGCVIGYCVELVFVVTAVTTTFPGIESVVPHNFTVVMLVGLGALPLRPLQTLGLGSSMLMTYLGAMILYPDKIYLPDVSPLYLSSLFVVTIIFVALTAIVYHQRAYAFQARQQVVRAQARLAVAESTAAQGRLAAALSHELNSPIGIIGSNLQTLASARRRLQDGKFELEPFLKLFSDSEDLLRRSCRRLTDIVARMQRFTNLERSEESSTDLRLLIEDTVEMLRLDLEESAEITMSLETLPSIRCRPQQMSAVLSNLLLNSKNAMVVKGTIRLTAALRGEEILIEVADDGGGIPADRLDQIFEPSFTVSQGRVSTANWGLFHGRNTIVGLGGSMEIESTEGEGTKVTIVLPLTPTTT